MPLYELTVPLTAAQVRAANELHESLQGWRLFDSVLADLREHLPSNHDIRHVLPKAITLNSLYSTTVYAIHRMAQHIVSVHEAGNWTLPAELVTQIANLPLPGKPRRFLSFASKYCHFFVDRESYPILDSFAWEALMLHLGKAKVDGYQAYIDATTSLCQSAGGCSFAELDRYLWLRGQWTAYHKGQKQRQRVNGEVLPLFETRPGDSELLLAQAFPSV